MQLENCAGLFRPFASGTLFTGFSGGADSTCALLAALHFRERLGYRLVAVHFNHHLRGAESDREEREAAVFAAELGVEFLRFDLDPHAGGSPEAAARKARLEVWKRLAAGRADTAVVLGHHAGDRLENLLLRLGRGSNVSGIAGLRASSMVEGVRFLRPLLGFTRSEIETFLRDRGIRRWAEDSSNADPAIPRNRLRHRVLPELQKALPDGVHGMLRSLDMLEIDADFLESEAKRRFDQVRGAESTPASFWRELHPALLVRVLRLYLSEAAGSDRIPPAALPAKLTELLATDSPELRRLPAGGGVELQLRNGWIRVLPTETDERPFPESPLPWRWGETPEIPCGEWLFTARIVPAHGVVAAGPGEAYFDAAALPETLWIEPAHPGDRLIPFGRTREERLKKLRTDRKIPTAELPPLLRLAPGGAICWAPHVRHTATAPVGAETGRILRVEIRRSRELPPGTGNVHEPI